MALSAESDTQLIVRTLDGQTGAFGRLVDRHRTAVYSLAYRMLGDRDRADDAAQEAFVRAYESLHTFRPSGSFRSWLLSIASNLCIDRLRSRPFSAEKPVADFADVQSRGPDPETLAGRQEISRLIHRALGRLSDAQRAVIVLVYMEQMTYEQAAGILGVPLGTVKSHASRGRRRLKDILAPHLEEPT